MSTVVPITAARPLQLDPNSIAGEQLWKLRGEPRDVALDGCIEHLMINHDMTERSAENTAMRELAAVEAITSLDSIDISVTTTSTLVINRSDGYRVFLTVRDLRELLKGKGLVAGNKDSGRLLLLSRQ